MCCSAKVKRLADEISHLTLLETLDLTDILKDILGMSNRCVAASLSLVTLIESVHVEGLMSQLATRDKR